MLFRNWQMLLNKKMDRVEMRNAEKTNIDRESNFIPNVKLDDGYISPTICKKSEVTEKQEKSLQNSVNASKTTKKWLTNNKKSEKPVTLKEKLSNNDLCCLVCNLKFNSVELLLDHQEDSPVTDKINYICRVCTQEFGNHKELEAHFLMHKVVKCKACREEFRCLKDLYAHRQEMHKSERLECGICNKTFSDHYTLKRHRLINHIHFDDTNKCIVCGNSYKFQSQLESHLKNTHVPYEYIECGFCHKIYFGPERLKQHIKSMHLNPEANVHVSCTICGKVIYQATLSQHMQTHDETESLCEICGLSIKGKSAMKTHMNQKHPTIGAFTCKICNKQFNEKMLLRKHSKSSHYKRHTPLPVFCEICGKVYKTVGILNKHKLIHSSERPFKCEICGATFKQSVTLKLHRRVHSNVGKYCCSKCGLSFKWKQTFDRHIIKCKTIINNS